MSSRNIVNNIKKEVQLLLDSNEVEKAFSLLLTVVYLSPQCLLHVQDIFVNTLCIIGQLEEKNNNLDKLFKLYEEGIKHYPEDPIIYSNLGAHLFRLGYTDEARSYFEKSLTLDTSHLPAQSNLHNIYNLVVPRWHYAMLNDKRRNESFEAAIAEAIKDGYDSVLDIGTGTGLLSLYAVEHGASKVFSCDYSKTMIDIATQVIHANNMADKIKLIPKLSNNIRIPEDIPSRVSLVVTETVDAGGMGEHILQTVKYALENLLQQPQTMPNVPQKKTGLVIPGRLKLFAQVIECEYLRTKYKFQLRTTERWRRGCKQDPFEGKIRTDIGQNCDSNTTVLTEEIPVDFTSRCNINQPSPEINHANFGPKIKAEQNSNARNSSLLEDYSRSPCFEFHARKQLNANYDSEDFAHIPHKLLSLPVEVIDVNLNSLDDINRVLAGITQRFRLEFINTGTADAVISWFELELYKNITLSSSIESNSSWDQAVFPIFNALDITREEIKTEERTKIEQQEKRASETTKTKMKTNLEENPSDEILNSKSEQDEGLKSNFNTKGEETFLFVNCEDGCIRMELICESEKSQSERNLKTEAQNNSEAVVNQYSLGIADTTNDVNTFNNSQNVSQMSCSNKKESNVGSVKSRSSKTKYSKHSNNTSSSKKSNLNDIHTKTTFKGNCHHLSNSLGQEVKHPSSNILSQPTTRVYSVHSDAIQCCQLIWPRLDSMVASISKHVGKVANILDLSGFPLVGIECLNMHRESKLFYLLDEDMDAILTSVLTSLDIDPVRYYCLTKSDLTYDLHKHLKFDVVLLDMLDSRGDFSSLQLMSPIKACLSEKALLLPQRIDIYVQLVHSDWLERQGHMLPERDRYKIAPFINQYSVSQHPDVDILSLPHSPFSLPTLLASLPSLHLPFSSTQPIMIHSSGQLNGIVYWLSPGLEASDLESEEKEKQEILNPELNSPGRVPVFERDLNSRLPTGVFFVKPAFDCEQGKSVDIQLEYEPGYLRLTLE